jgi:hypothetical protein
MQALLLGLAYNLYRLRPCRFEAHRTGLIEGCQQSQPIS